MQKVVIDTFIVPDGARAEFLENSRVVQDFLKTLPGFIEGFVHEKIAGAGSYDVITTAVWADEKALEDARKSVAEEFKQRGFDPQALLKRLNAEGARAVYQRSPY